MIDEHESTLKPKLTIDEQIKHMKQQGISFELCSEQEAREFLENHNYFFKIKSYAKNYEKHNDIYKNLDFAYLVEFSKLDMYLRRFILNLCLDVEHLLKVSLNAHFCNNSSEDGYQVVKDFLLENPNIKKQINKKASSVSFIKNLTSKYQENFALWNLIEILSFGDFLKFYQFYFKQYPDKQHQQLYSLAYCAHILRNAAAHNNCILNTIKIPYNENFSPNKYLQTQLAKMPNLSALVRQKVSSSPLLHDIVALIMLFNELCVSEEIRKIKKQEILKLLKRFKKNKNYFIKNDFIILQFKIFQKITYFLFFKPNISKKCYHSIAEQKCVTAFSGEIG